MIYIEMGERRGAYNKLKTHCSKGHSFDAKNTKLVNRNGKLKRYCRACHAEGVRRRKAQGKIG